MTYYLYYSDARGRDTPLSMLVFCNIKYGTVGVVKKFTKSTSVFMAPLSHYVGSTVDKYGRKFKTFRELQKYTYIMSGIVIKEGITYD